MTMTTVTRLQIAALIMLLHHPVTAQPDDASATSRSSEAQVHHRTSADRQSGDKPWEQWNLTQTDWNRYQSIMAGPRGNWSPDISPISALGIHAITEVDRMRYAEIAAKQDWERLMSERAWYLTYGVAKDRYFGERLKELEATQKTLSDTAASDHLVLFTDDQCNPQCRRAVSTALDTGAAIDIHFVGVSSRDTIGEWAKANRIPPEAVNKTKRVTLNIDSGMFQRIALDATLPQLFHRDVKSNQLTEVQW